MNFLQKTENNKTEPFVSIVTPVYNGEAYLRECIESVLSQSYENWEYVIVNNCSTDRTLEIVEDYAEKDKRIRIVNNSEHYPVLKNLNHAFRQISTESKYCKVIHADDWMFAECITKMVDIAVRYPSTGIIAAYRLDGNKVGMSGLPYPSHHNDGKEIATSFLLGETSYFGAPSNLLLRTDMIRKRENFYDPEYLQSDLAACLDILQETDFGFVHQVLTFTRRHEESVTETQAKKYSAQMFGYLKMMQDYGPVFLNSQEFKRRMTKTLDNFYIQFVRDIYDYGYRLPYKKHTDELESLGLQVEHGRLLKYFLRELILKGFNLLGFELTRR